MNSIVLRTVTQSDWLKFHAAYALPQAPECFLAEQQARPAEQRVVALRGKTELGIIELVPLGNGSDEFWLSLNPFPNVDLKAWVVAFCEVAQQAIAWGHKRVWLLVSHPVMRKYYFDAGYLSGGTSKWAMPDGNIVQAEWFAFDREIFDGTFREPASAC